MLDRGGQLFRHKLEPVAGPYCDKLAATASKGTQRWKGTTVRAFRARGLPDSSGLWRYTRGLGETGSVRRAGQAVPPSLGPTRTRPVFHPGIKRGRAPAEGPVTWGSFPPRLRADSPPRRNRAFRWSVAVPFVSQRQVAGPQAQLRA